SYATAHHWHAYLLLAMGEPDQAVAEARKVDPLSLVINTDLGEMLAYSGRYDASIQQFRRTLQMEPDFMLAHSGLGITYMLKGQLGESLNELRKASDLPGGKTWVLPALACALAGSGQRVKAEELLRQLEAQEV